MKIIIDAGHGGKDGGGGTNKKWLEKDFALKVSEYQYKRFKELGIYVEMTRDDDIYLGSTERSLKVKESNAKYCISNHINAGGGEGAEVIHSIYNDGVLATQILNEMVKAGQVKRRVFSRQGSNGKDYYYMHRLTGNVTTFIIEYGFADNINDTKRLLDNWQKYAEAVVKAICEYENIKYIEPNDNRSKKMNEIVDIMLKNDITVDDIKQLFAEAYSKGKLCKIRRFDSDIYVYETSEKEDIVIDLGVAWKKEKLSNLIRNNKYKENAAINGGFFDTRGNFEHLGTLIINGGYWFAPNDTFIDFIYYNDGRTEIKHIKDTSECAYLQARTKWVIGTSWALVIEGKINTMNKEKIDHSKYKNPRTMLGQKKDGTWILAVADGRNATSKGLTAEEEAQIMHELGAYNAVNLDGGGSSEMIVDNKIINDPSDGRERAIGSSILVISKE